MTDVRDSILPKRSRKRPLALVVDDEESVCKLLKFVLAKYGIDTEYVFTSREFIQKLKELDPDVCFIDLNIDVEGVGYKIIQAVRSVLGRDLVLFVASALSDQKAIAQAMKVGANDYLVKPIQRDMLVSKLSRYLRTEALMEEQAPMIPVPEGGAPAELFVDMEIHEIDEKSLRISGRHLLVKDLVLPVESDLLREISGKASPVLLRVTETWLENSPASGVDDRRPGASNENPVYGARMEFDSVSGEFRERLRQWIMNNA